MVIPTKVLSNQPHHYETCIGCHDEANSGTLIFDRIYSKLPAKVNRFIVEKLLNGISFDQLLRLILTGGTNLVSLMLNDSFAQEKLLLQKTQMASLPAIGASMLSLIQ